MLVAASVAALVMTATLTTILLPIIIKKCSLKKCSRKKKSRQTEKPPAVPVIHFSAINNIMTAGTNKEKNPAGAKTQSYQTDINMKNNSVDVKMQKNPSYEMKKEYRDKDN